MLNPGQLYTRQTRCVIRIYRRSTRLTLKPLPQLCLARLIQGYSYNYRVAYNGVEYLWHEPYDTRTISQELM
jgi:hypothetical protein